MKDVILSIDKVTIAQFDPKKSAGRFAIHFRKNNERLEFEKQYTLDHPEPIVQDILKEVKQRGKIEIIDSDDILGSIFVVRLLDEDNVDEKLFNFFSRLVEKTKMMQRMKNYAEYMKLYDEIKIKELQLTR